MTFYESAAQGRVTLGLLALGACAGLLLDITGVLFRGLPSAARIALDILLCAACGGFCAYLLVVLDAGEFRLYAVLCALVGAGLYVACVRMPLRAAFFAAKRRKSQRSGE